MPRAARMPRGRTRLRWWLMGALVLGGIAVVHRSSPPAPALRLSYSEVRGSSLSRTLPAGTRVSLELGYYDRRAVERDQVVAFRVASHAAPVIKIAKGLPGDELSLVERDGKRMIEVNGRALVNADGWPYHLSISSHRLLSLYVRDYQGRIPADAYLLLGDAPTGGLDSTRLGLIHHTDLIARVLPRDPALSRRPRAAIESENPRGT